MLNPIDDMGRELDAKFTLEKRAGVDLVEQRRAEEVAAVRGRDEVVVGGVERTLVVAVGVVGADLRSGPDAEVFVEVTIVLRS